jgi:hypothetical protein
MAKYFGRWLGHAWLRAGALPGQSALDSLGTGPLVCMAQDCNAWLKVMPGPKSEPCSM